MEAFEIFSELSKSISSTNVKFMVVSGVLCGGFAPFNEGGFSSNVHFGDRLVSSFGAFANLRK